MVKLGRRRALTGAAVALAGLALVIVGPTLVGAQETQSQEDGWQELTPQVCAERSADADTPRMSAFLDELVSDGAVDQSQADEIERRLHERGESACVGMILYQPGQMIEAIAETTATQPRDVLRALRDGATPAEYAAQYDVPEAELIEAVMADSHARAAELVASGELDQARADELLVAIEERIAAAIHRTHDELPRRWQGARDELEDVADALNGFFGR